MHYTPLGYLRATKGLTQFQLSELSGLHRVTLSRMEHGMMLRDLPTIDRLAAALGVTRGQLLGEEPIPGFVPPSEAGASKAGRA